MRLLRNRVQLIGYVGTILSKEDSIQHQKIIRFSLVTTEKYRNKKGEVVKESSSNFIVAKGKIAEFAEKNLKIGTQLIVEGKLAYRKMEETKTYAARIEISDLIILKQMSE